MRTGYRLALGVAGATIALALVLAVVELFASPRDPVAYGEVPVPGRASVSMPAGEVIVFYGERATGEPSSLTVPPNLRLRVRTTRGQLLGPTPFAGDPFRDGDHLRRSLAKLEVPEAGAYEAVSSSMAPGADSPVLSFGRTGSRDFGYVLFVLAGGLLLAAILAGVTVLWPQRERPGGR
jgi:hypothetical protein